MWAGFQKTRRREWKHWIQHQQKAITTFWTEGSREEKLTRTERGALEGAVVLEGETYSSYSKPSPRNLGNKSSFFTLFPHPVSCQYFPEVEINQSPTAREPQMWPYSSTILTPRFPSRGRNSDNGAGCVTKVSSTVHPLCLLGTFSYLHVIQVKIPIFPT